MVPTRPPRRTRTLTSLVRTLVVAALAALAVLALQPGDADARRLLQTDQQIRDIRAHVRQGHQPWASSWAWFKGGHLKTAMNSSPQPYKGPYRGGGVSNGLELALDRDGHRARNAAVGYAVSGNATYAKKARAYLVAWARTNVPTRYADCRDKYMGTYQSHGAFCFAYAYDLTSPSGVYSAADHTLIRAYFRRFATAMKTYTDQVRSDYILSHPASTAVYGWKPNSGFRYNVYDYYLGGDLPALTTVARFALARMGRDGAQVGQMLKASDKFSLQTIISKASAPRNSGDGRPGHPKPVPQVQIFKPGYRDNSARGGCVDYMTYNQRAVTILLIMGKRAGADVSKQRQQALRSWRYLARYFGPGAERSPAPNDVISNVSLPRFVLPLYFYGKEFLPEARAGDERSYYESQFLGPTTLTLWK
jgi:hypothetical protein